jgi:hypothetical protein
MQMSLSCSRSSLGGLKLFRSDGLSLTYAGEGIVVDVAYFSWTYSRQA